MKHRFIRRQLPVLLYGELTGWKAALTLRHLRHCGDCRREFEELQSLHNLLSETEAAPVPEADLMLARQRIVADTDARSPNQRRRALRLGEIVPRRGPSRRRVLTISAQVFAGAVAGFLAATILWPSSQDDHAALEKLPTEQLRIENVRFLGDDPAGEELELELEAFRPVRIRGSVSDPQIQHLLAQAIISEGNAGVRLRAVSVLRSPSPSPVDPKIRRALLTAMTTDENAGVRMAALEAVRQLPLDAENRNALLHVVLYDLNPGLRITAINALEAFMTDFTREDDAALRNHRGELESDDNAYVRWKARTVLLERGAL